MHLILNILTTLLRFLRIYHAARLLLVIAVPVIFFIVWLILAIILGIKKSEYGTFGQRFVMLFISEMGNIVAVLLAMLVFYFAGRNVTDVVVFRNMIGLLLKMEFYFFGISSAIIPLCSMTTRKKILFLCGIGSFLLICLIILGIIVTLECSSGTHILML